MHTPADPHPPHWPQQRRAAVALAFDLDGPTGSAMLDGSLWGLPGYFALGGYGPFRALPRLLDLLDDADVPATFFTPAWVVEHWPDACRSIIERGHEVAHHGYRHECYYDLTVGEQADVISRSQRVFKSVLGIEASGFRSPSGDWHPETPRLLLEHGFRYSSSMRGDDRPYLHTIDQAVTALVEIPARWDFDDYASLAYHRNPDYPGGQDRIASYALTLDNWKREFDGYRAEGLCLTTLLHPKVSGRPGRLLILEELIDHMRAHDDVWFATCGDVADWWVESRQGLKGAAA
ncbi:polysaccharide deacetylase family protein [Streptomyces iranensis]|uniref:Peptidoglycan/xylan/chitin deacetylase (PgdA/CDA1 family) n=1 Tax=Streptomyces iranensis TaxID=576784 RepID=A0A060ZSH9_9ACTN|nr:polysaccharide deacetylase [Streptomyces iranensis]MBP2068207.1 peptidoglycan/xylan/chitin deacetylase (PgdA/CDA1 family) [Streptomyces iranensis]CDR09152.1 polysaccharide deacetylase [Streptomyces iranensis]